MLQMTFDKVAQLLVLSDGNRALSSQHLAAADSLATKTLQLRAARFHHTDSTFPDSCTAASKPQSLLLDEKRMFVRMGEVEAYTHVFSESWGLDLPSTSCISDFRHISRKGTKLDSYPSGKTSLGLELTE